MSKMKYSYRCNGQIIRSANRFWKFALVDSDNRVIGCSETEQILIDEKMKALKRAEQSLEHCKQYIYELVPIYKMTVTTIKNWRVVTLEKEA